MLKSSNFYYYFKKIFNLKNIFLSLILINFNIFFWNLFLNPVDGFFLMFIATLIISAFVIETYLYTSSSNKTMLRLQELNNESKYSIKISMFLITFLFLWFISLMFVFFIWFYQNIGLLNGENVAGIGGSSELILWNLANLKWWGFFLYQINFLILILISYIYLLNHFIKNKNLIYMITIVSLLFSMMSFLEYPFNIANRQLENGEFGWVLQKNIKTTWIIISYIFFPWMQIDSFLRESLMILDWDKLDLMSYFNFDGVVKILFSLPYITVFTCITLPLIFKK